MANHMGTRWRGQIPVPGNAHPLVRTFIQCANEQQTVLSEIAVRSGVAAKTLSDWRYRSSPTVVNFEAALNALGLELRICEANTRKVVNLCPNE